MIIGLIFILSDLSLALHYDNVPPSEMPYFTHYRRRKIHVLKQVSPIDEPWQTEDDYVGEIQVKNKSNLKLENYDTY